LTLNKIQVCRQIIATHTSFQKHRQLGFLALFISSQPAAPFLCCKPCAKGLSHRYCFSKSPSDSKDRSPAAWCYHRQSGSNNWWSQLVLHS
uniref:Uncharacterized protein n=1 Tax=Catagonus wagneri TaxID=51154 RepID=A0A8C3WV55_9CETA